MDWKDALKQLRDETPEMAAETDIEATEAAEDRPQLPRIDVMVEKKGRAGKQATILCGMAPAMSDDEIARLASKIKQRLATGGSSRGGEILIQGDRRDEVMKLLVELGYPKPRRVGS